jgi:lantibiotic modifying enzyme
MSWQPILQGALKDLALESVKAILDELAPLEGKPGGEPCLAGGTAGLALLHSYLLRAERRQEHSSLALRCLEHATGAVSNVPAEASFYSGLTGIGWALAHLRGRLPGLDGEEDLTEIDDALLGHLGQLRWTGDYDLISGLVGFGIYALERLPRPRPAACLERVINHLAATAERRAEGVTWWTNPAWLPADTRDKYPRGYYNLGLAHGVPGVVALLGLACAAGVACDKARPLLNGAANWVLAQQKPGGFPHWVEPEVADGPARLAWCYGDPGVAAALLWTARCVAEPVWEREAVAIARRAARRPPEQAGVHDAGLCHGAAGLGHLFNRMFQATGEPHFGDAARCWFEQTVAMRRPGQGIGGYQAWQLGKDGEPTWVTESGLLTGTAGIALALLAATTPIEPSWDRMLLVAIPPTPAS